jgi:hypothetical protein
VAIASDDTFEHSYFKLIKNQFDLHEASIDSPIIITDLFNESSQIINESLNYKYNSSITPDWKLVEESFSNSSYFPKQVSDIKKIKDLRFPIVAQSGSFSDEYKSVGKLKSAERIYKNFKERPVPRTRFKILAFKNNPISIVEWINKFPIDVDLNNFIYISESEDLCNKIYDKFKLDVYNIEILESVDGRIYLESIDKKINLNPHQARLLYESIYEDYYKTRLPNWVKNKIINEHTNGYYKQKYYDLKLINSKHAINYSKYL